MGKHTDQIVAGKMLDRKNTKDCVRRMRFTVEYPLKLWRVKFPFRGGEVCFVTVLFISVLHQ